MNICTTTWNRLQDEAKEQLVATGISPTCDEIDELTRALYKETIAPSIRPDYRAVDAHYLMGQTVELMQVGLPGQPLDGRKRACVKVNGNAIADGPGWKMLKIYNGLISSYRNPHIIRRKKKDQKAS